MKNLSGRVAVITGAGSGMGAAMARRFARSGMKIVVSDIDAVAAETTRADLCEAGHTAIAVRTDVANPAEVEALAEAAYEHFGSVHLLCNNAGIVPSGRQRTIWEYPLEDWQWSLGVNLMGVVHGIRSFVPRMLAQGDEGHVVTTASVAGLVSSSGSVAYGIAKEAAIRATEALYAALQERGAPIGVTLLCPGLVNTSIYRSERNRPVDLRPAAGTAEETPELRAIADHLYGNAISPDEVADMVHQAVLDDQFYLLTTDKFDTPIRDRMEAILARRNPRFPSLVELSKTDLRNNRLQS
jgi:NAD(P)-dependent dehydrogenase (short-subunit alcohol dehydrogenase family)